MNRRFVPPKHEEIQSIIRESTLFEILGGFN